MKTSAKVVLVVLLITLMAGCAAPAPTATPAPKAAAPTAVPQPTAVPTLTATEAWLKAAELGKYAPAKQDWAAIEAAAKKEGKVLVYANSSRIADAAKLWEKKYPDIKLEGFDLGGDDVVVKVREEQKAGAFTGDVWFNGSGPDIAGEFYPKQYLWPFVPDNLLDVIPPEARNPFVVSRYGVRVLGYNSELNKTCPVTNLWELTEPAWKGKVFIEDPLNDASTMGILTTIVSHAKELAAAYKDKYGKDPVLEADTPDAGWLWLKKFAQNKPMAQPGGDEVVAAFATKGMKDNLLGFTSYSKYRDVQKGTLVFEPCLGLKPIFGVQTQAYLAIINRAPHPNAAKLFINFVLNEGFEPWNTLGNYSARTDVKEPKGAIPFAELSKYAWSIDDAYVYKNIIKVRDFYTINLLK